MAIRIYSAHVDQSLVTKALCALILLAPFAAEAQEFFEKNYAREMVEPEIGSHPAFGPASGSNKNARKIKSYEEYIAERREQGEAREAQKAEQEKSKKEVVKASPDSGLSASDLEGESLSPEGEANPESETKSSLPFEPIDVEAQGGVTLDIILSTSPAEHFFLELRRVVEVAKIKGVKIGEVSAVGKPPLIPEFVEALKDFNKTKKKIKFGMTPPNDMKVEYSPVWIVDVGGKKLVFEGEFEIREIFISNKNR